MKQVWFSKLYEKELISLKKKIKELEVSITNDKSDLSNNRKREQKKILYFL